MTTFRIGRVLGTTLPLWGRNLVPVVLITVLLHLPLILWELSVAQPEMLLGQLILFEYATGLVALPINFVVSALLACGVVAELEGHPLSLGGWCLAQPIPSSRARSAAWVRSATPSLPKMLVM
jgi:hypothetical protein